MTKGIVVKSLRGKISRDPCIMSYIRMQGWSSPKWPCTWNLVTVYIYFLTVYIFFCKDCIICIVRTLELVKCFQKNWNFPRILAPAQRAAGDCPPPKVTPGRGPPLGEFFFTELIKIKDFRVEIIVFMYFLMSFPMKTFVYFFVTTHFYLKEFPVPNGFCCSEFR